MILETEEAIRDFEKRAEKWAEETPKHERAAFYLAFAEALKGVVEARPKFVTIEWRDAALMAGWHNKEGIEKIIADGPPTIQTSGHLIQCDKNVVYIASSISEKRYGDIHVIPFSLVKSMSYE